MSNRLEILVDMYSFLIKDKDELEVEDIESKDPDNLKNLIKTDIIEMINDMDDEEELEFYRKAFNMDVLSVSTINEDDEEIENLYSQSE